MSADSADKIKQLVRMLFENWNELHPSKIKEALSQKDRPGLFRLGKAAEDT